jgi:hypothetical protein
MIRIPIARDGLHQLISEQDDDPIALVFDDHGS